MRKGNPKQKFKVERLEYESLINETIFRDLYNRAVYFVDTDLKSKDYFKLGFNSDMIFTAGKNLIRIKGKPGQLLQNTPLLIEAQDRTGLPLKTSIYDLKNETSDKVICVEVHEATPPGDIKLTLAATAVRDPNGNPIPQAWQNDINFKWSQIFEARPFTSNRSDILFNEETTPQIEVNEVIKPWNKLTYNTELITNIGGSTSTNNRSKYRLQTGGNTRSKVSYRKSGGHYFITAHAFTNNILDFGGFTADMVGGILIVAEPINPRPRSVAGYDAPQVYSPIEDGDGFKIRIATSSFDEGGFSVTSSATSCFSDDDEDQLFTEVFIAGAYQTTVLEFISPWEIRVKDPHTTWQGLKEETFRKFEHTQFDPSMYRLIWNQKPQSCDPTPLHESTSSVFESMKNSYAHVKFTNLTPASGDVTRIKSYTRNNQSTADWQLASDMTVDAKEMLFCEKETCTTPAGDFSRWGVGDEGILSVLPYWDAEGIGATLPVPRDPSLSLYYQQGAQDSPPTPDSLVVGTNISSSYLTDDNHWILYSKIFPKFKKGKMYQLEISSVSTKTQEQSWLPNVNAVGDPEIEVFMTGSSFKNDVNSKYNYGQRVGRIKTSADKEKHVEQDRYNKDLTKGYKFLFVADDDGAGRPLIKINSGLWQFWNISLKPLDLFGFTPEEFEVTFPTPKCDVKQSEAIDFKFEFYNDYGTVSNYTSVLNNIDWKNEHTAVFDNLVVNTLYADFLVSTASVTNLQPVTFSAGIFVEGDTTIGTHATQSLILNADIQIPYLASASDAHIVTYNPNTDRLMYSTTQSGNFGAPNPAPIQHSFISATAEDGQTVTAVGLNDSLEIEGDGKLITTTKVGAKFRIAQHATPTFIYPFTASSGFFSMTESVFSGSTSMSGKIDIGLCCEDDITIRGDIKFRCLDFDPNPSYIISYDYPTRTIFYSPAPVPSTGGGGEGGCTTSFGIIGVFTQSSEFNDAPGSPDLLTASTCGDNIFFAAGLGIKLDAGPYGGNSSLIQITNDAPSYYKITTDLGNSTATGSNKTIIMTGGGGIKITASTDSNTGNTQLHFSSSGGSGGSDPNACTASFGSLGLVTSSRSEGASPAAADFIFTASSCADTIVFEQGAGIVLSQSSAGVINTNHTVHISAAPTAITPGWKTLVGNTGTTTTTAVGQALTVIGTGGTNTSASVNGNGAKITIDSKHGYCFHWGGRSIYEWTGSATGEIEGEAQYGDTQSGAANDHSQGAGYPLLTVPFYTGLGGYEVNQPVGYFPGTVGGNSDCVLDADLHLYNCGWTVPHDGAVTELRGWVGTSEQKPVSASLEVHKLSVVALRDSCGDLTSSDHIEIFNVKTVLFSQDASVTTCRYYLKETLSTPISCAAGDVLVPMWSFKPTSDGSRKRMFIMNLTIS